MAAALILLGVAYVGQQFRQDWQPQDTENNENVEAMIDRVTGENEYVKSMNLNQAFNRQITFLSREELAVLKVENQLYQRLPEKDLYRVDYSHPTQGRYLAVVDPEEEEVIMFYRLSGVNVS